MTDQQEHRLEDGCSPATPPDNTIQRGFVMAQAARVEAEARAMGCRVVRTDNIVFGDRGVPDPILNQCILLRPVAAIGLDALAEAVTDCQRGGWPVSYWSVWPTPDLGHLGLVLAGHPPLMFRAAGPPPPGADGPSGLQIVEVGDDDGYATFARTAIEGFGMHGLRDVADGLWDERVAASGWRFWLGLLDGEPVATAAGFTSHGVNVVEVISTVPGARGRGVGAAVTWRATLADPTLPAVLVASDLGRPVYERMGYVAISRATLWLGGVG